MKKIILIIMSVLLVASCSNGVRGKFEKLAADVEANSASYTEKQWKKTADRFDELMTEYSEKYDNLSTADKKAINKCIARYGKAVLESGVKEAAASLDKALEEMPSAIGKFLDGTKAILDGLAI